MYSCKTIISNETLALNGGEAYLRFNDKGVMLFGKYDSYYQIVSQ